MGKANAPAGEETEQPIEKPLDRIGLRKSCAVHTSHDHPNRSKRPPRHEPFMRVQRGRQQRLTSIRGVEGVIEKRALLVEWV